MISVLIKTGPPSSSAVTITAHFGSTWGSGKQRRLLLRSATLHLLSTPDERSLSLLCAWLDKCGRMK